MTGPEKAGLDLVNGSETAVLCFTGFVDIFGPPVSRYSIVLHPLCMYGVYV